MSNVGDEADQYFASKYPKDPDAPLSPSTEILETRGHIREWAAAFPFMKLCISNHGLRWTRRAFDAGIPSEALRPYKELLGAPDGWKWKEVWKFTGWKHHWMMMHGMGYSGVNGHRNAAIDNGMSTVIGHLHANAGIAHIATATQRIWGFNVGCLIDVGAYAFHYGKECRNKPILGVGVILDGGSTPIFIPFEG